MHTNGVEQLSNSCRAFAILAAILPAANMQRGVDPSTALGTIENCDTKVPEVTSRRAKIMKLRLPPMKMSTTLLGFGGKSSSE